MSPELFFPIPFCDGGKSFLDWFFREPLPLPAPGIGLPWPVGFLAPRPDPPRPSTL